MIQYALKCANDHQFDSWFQSASAFEKLMGSGMVTCAHCGSGDVSKAIMAPRVNANSTPEPLTGRRSEVESQLAKLKKHVEANSDYVGRDFAREARAIHDGDAPARAIWGETRGDEVRKLIDDGVPIAPLPFTPTRKTN